MARKTDPLNFSLNLAPRFTPSVPTRAIPGDPGGSSPYPPTRTAPSATGTVISGFNPTPAATPAPPVDYRSLILNDPMYQQQVAQYSADLVQAAAERKANIDQALVHFGEVPNLTNAISGLGLSPASGLFQSLQTDIDPATVRSAQGLTSAGLSTVARLQRGHNTTMDNLMSTLAARGIVRSGATGVGTNLENQNYIGAQYDARQTLLNYLSGVQAAYAAAQNQYEQNVANAATAAAGRGAGGTPPSGGDGSSSGSGSGQVPLTGPGGNIPGNTVSSTGYAPFPSFTPAQRGR